jgi:HlyD family secretion protein
VNDDRSEGKRGGARFRAEAPVEEKPKRHRRSLSSATVIVALIIAAIVGLSGWYLVQPQPLLVQGEADSTRIDMAARVDGRVAEIPIARGENVGGRRADSCVSTTPNCWRN